MIEHDEQVEKIGPPDARWLYPDFRSRCAEFEIQMEKEGFPVRMVEGFRSLLRSQYLYSLGRTKPGKIITHARPGESYHNFGLAADYCFHGPSPFDDSHPWALLGKVALSVGCKWGGTFASFPDRPHVQADYPILFEEMKTEYLRDGVVGVWIKVDQVRAVPVGGDWNGDVFENRLS